MTGSPARAALRANLMHSQTPGLTHLPASDVCGVSRTTIDTGIGPSCLPAMLGCACRETTWRWPGDCRGPAWRVSSEPVGQPMRPSQIEAATKDAAISTARTAVPSDSACGRNEQLRRPQRDDRSRWQASESGETAGWTEEGLFLFSLRDGSKARASGARICCPASCWAIRATGRTAVGSRRDGRLARRLTD